MTTNTIHRNFSDARVFVVGINDPRTHQFHELDHLGCEQAFEGPRYVVVGPDVSDERFIRNLPDLIARYGVTLHLLKAVRDSQLEVSQ